MAKSLLKVAGAALMFGSAGVAIGHEGHEEQVVHIARADLAAKVAKTSDGLGVATLPTGPNAVAIQVRREKSGEAEVHDAVEDIFVAQSGRATVVVGKVTGARNTAPGEWRGGTIEESARYDLAPGDILWIPAGLGHQTLVPKGKSFNYLAMKFPAKPTP